MITSSRSRSIWRISPANKPLERLSELDRYLIDGLHKVYRCDAVGQ